MTTLLHEEIPYEFSELFVNDYVKVLSNPSHKIIICESISTYIPIEDFIKTFNTITQNIKKEGITKFIFDKRSLTSFHQPSMEWYFLVWKKELLHNGLTMHRKVLPPLPWFRECVDACKGQMLNNADHSFLSQIDVKYFDSVKECIEN